MPTGTIALASDGAFERVGSALAVVYIGYGAFLLVGLFFMIHGLMLAYLLAIVWMPRLRLTLIVLAAEVLYGLMNPLVYLLVIERHSVFPRQWLLSLAASSLLVLIWGSRFTLGFDSFRPSRAARLYVRALAIAAVVCVVAFLAKDVGAVFGAYITAAGVAAVPPPSQTAHLSLGELLGAVGMLSSLAALYATPIVLALTHLQSTTSEHAWQDGRRFFARLPWIGCVGAALAIASLTIVAYRPPAAQVERLVVRHRDQILDAARHHAVDPGLIASIVYVVHRDLTTPFADRLERAAMAAWMSDPTNNFFLTEPLDVSVGLVQIKPLTAMAALVILDARPVPTVSMYFKEYRGVRPLGAQWRLPDGALRFVDAPFRGLLRKHEVVEALFDDRRNIEMCGLILALYAAQWEAANPAWSIRRRPEILATLYQIGFEKSWPKPDPRPNRFGERVGEVYRSPFIQRTFPAAAA